MILAGTNGAGKSSIGGQMIEAAGSSYYNPDIETQVLMRRFNLRLNQANVVAWHEGRRLLEYSIDNGIDLALETTLGGNTIPGLIRQACKSHEVRIWYCGLSSPDLHIKRVKARVKRGGHNIPKKKIIERYSLSINNLITMIPIAHEIKVYDNSAEASRPEDMMPEPVKVLHMREGSIINIDDLEDTPEWAKGIVYEAMQTHLTGG